MNKVFLIGNLGKDAEVVSEHLKFTLATNDGWGDNKETNWHSCIAFKKGKLAQYLKKGDKVAVMGRIKYRKHEEKYYTSIVVNDIELLSGGAQTVSNETNLRNDNLPF